MTLESSIGKVIPTVVSTPVGRFTFEPDQKLFDTESTSLSGIEKAKRDRAMAFGREYVGRNLEWFAKPMLVLESLMRTNPAGAREYNERLMKMFVDFDASVADIVCTAANPKAR